MPRWWPAPAKLNLYLHVTGRRADGYHLLDSLVAFASVGDRLAVSPGPALNLEIEGAFAPALAGDAMENLAVRAARALAAQLGRDPAASLRLEKNLPVASGIGGGSSDAAAALKALNALWQGRLDEVALMTIAAPLGADVPVCVAQRPSWLGGIGERIEDAPSLPAAPLVLVNPNLPLPTAAVFKARRGPFSPAARFDRAPRDAAELAALLAERRNDLTEPALAQMPAIAAVLARLEAAPGALLARMSGSGATCFALFQTTTAADEAAAAIKSEKKSWWAESGRLLKG